MRYGVSGHASRIDEASGVGEHLLGKAITSGRVLWVRNWWLHRGYDLSGIILALVDVSAAATYTASTVRAVLGTVSTNSTASTTSRQVMWQLDYPAPGIKFTQGCRIIAEQSLVAVIGTGLAGGLGYEE